MFSRYPRALYHGGPTVSKKKHILQAAIPLFARKGFKDTSMAELAKAAGVACGTILYHYDSKEALFQAALSDIETTLLSDFRELVAASAEANGLDRVQSVITAYLRLAGETEDRFLMLHRHDAYRLAQINPACRRHLESIYNGLVDIFEHAVHLGQGDGSIGEMPARKTALILFSLVDGIARLNTYKLYDGGALYDELLRACRRMLES